MVENCVKAIGGIATVKVTASVEAVSLNRDGLIGRE
jgi:hypothetical protein